MPSLIDLWLPIVLSAVGVFVVSSVIHMVLPLHKSDVTHVPDEEKVLAAMRDAGVTPGDYMFPGCTSMKDMQNPDYIARCEQGPVGFMTVVPSGVWDMKKGLTQWFLFSLVVSLCTGYLATFAVPIGASGSLVFRLTATAAWMGYGLGQIPNSIWRGLKWSTTAKFLFDSLLYGLATGAIFMWMWPESIIGS